jgi:opacity protein-like surface antigen
VAASALAVALAPAALAQDTQNNTASTARSTVAAGQKTKLTGAVVSRGADSFVLQDDATGAQTTVLFNDRTSVKTKGGFFGGGTKYALTSVTRGLHVEVEGRGDSSGNVVADKIRFTDTDLRTARTLEANIVPVEGRVGTAENRIGEAEQNAQRMSGQLEE